MTPLAIAVILICVVALTAVLVTTLLSFKKTAMRAESVLHLVEREIRPMASQLESLAAELRALSHNANANLERIGGVVDRVEDISLKVARVVGVIGALTSMGQYASVAAGVRRGLEVFLGRLRNRHH